jgi:hypothetical protein
MAIAITKKHLSRRSFLAAAGATLALPWFEAMLPALATPAQAAAATVAPRRFVAINHGLGFHAPHLFPAEAGAAYKPTPYLEPLADLRGDFTVFSGLSHAEQNGLNGHTSELTILTSAKHPGLPGFRNTVSLDQYLVEKLVPDTRYPYLTLNTSGSDSLSWSAGGVNLPADSSPAKLFQRLFVGGNADAVRQQVRELQRGRSILDTVNGRARALNARLGARDQDKFDQYLTSVRELEARLQAAEGWVHKPKPQVAAKPPTDIADRAEVIGRQRLMNEMIVLALQTDSTRFITLKSAGGGEVPKIEGVDTGWHDLSHHGQDEKKIEQLARIERAEFAEHARLLAMLKDAKEANASVLDSTAVLITSNLGSASGHSWRDLPVILAGGGFKHRGHVVAGGKGNDNARLCNLFVAIARQTGVVAADQFGSSDGTAVKGFDAV